MSTLAAVSRTKYSFLGQPPRCQLHCNYFPLTRFRTTKTPERVAFATHSRWPRSKTTQAKITNVMFALQLRGSVSWRSSLQEIKKHVRRDCSSADFAYHTIICKIIICMHILLCQKHAFLHFFILSIRARWDTSWISRVFCNLGRVALSEIGVYRQTMKNGTQHEPQNFPSLYEVPTRKALGNSNVDNCCLFILFGIVI